MAHHPLGPGNRLTGEEVRKVPKVAAKAVKAARKVLKVAAKAAKQTQRVALAWGSR